MLWSNDGSSAVSRMEFRTIDTSGGVAIAGVMDAVNGWAFESPVTVNNAMTVNGATLITGATEVDNNLTVDFNVLTAGLTVTGGSTLDGGASLNGDIQMNGNNIFLTMAHPVNYPTAGKTLAQTQACLDQLITSMINRGLVS